jgi:hypothetical protein
MAGIYVSYRHTDRDLVNGLAPLLKRRGHSVFYDWGLHVGASWRDELLAGLLISDALVVVWGETTHESQYIPAEVGAARASGTVAVLPLLVAGTSVPPFLQDLVVEQVGGVDAVSLEALADKLDASIAHHVARRDAHKAGQPKIFISHRHTDHVLVQRLIDCITTYFDIATTDIRATSIAPYRLRAGENTSERLRRDIAEAEVVLGVLGPDTMDSVYVAFELGSAWGQGIWTCPLLTGGAGAEPGESGAATRSVADGAFRPRGGRRRAGARTASVRRASATQRCAAGGPARRRRRGPTKRRAHRRRRRPPSRDRCRRSR